MTFELDLEDRLNFAIHMAKQLSQKQLMFSHQKLDLTRKGDDSPVTQADLESEIFFREEVKRVFPEDKVVGEEHGADSDGGPKWVIDPIDGTRKFMRGLPFWGICIAFEVEQSVELGVIAVPGAMQIWSAQKGKGAYRNSQKIQVDNHLDSLNRAFVTMPARPYFLKDGFVEAYDATQGCIEHDPGFLDAYSYGMVADGRIHGVLSCSDMWWDIAAAVRIIEEAGGVFTDIEGNQPRQGSLNLAASKSCHELLLKKLEEL